MTVSANESRKIMERIGFPQEAVDTIGDCTERVTFGAGVVSREIVRKRGFQRPCR